MNEKVKYWLDLSDYDYTTAVAMQQSGRYLYVGFMCHQTIEKILKAYFNLNNSEPAPPLLTACHTLLKRPEYMSLLLINLKISLTSWSLLILKLDTPPIKRN